MRALTVVALVLAASHAEAKIVTQVVEYKQGDTVLEGYLAFDDAAKGKRPGVIVVHDWMGVSANTKARVEALAKLGYVAFAADIYGKGVRPKSPDEAGKLATTYKKDRALMRARVTAALEQLKTVKKVDPTKLAAIGYCFGGTTVLELARSGADVSAIVSFHGGLSADNPADARNIKGRILALHGADDPFVPAAEVAAFQDEMRKAGVDWQMVSYGGAVHAFTVPDAGTDNAKGAAYNKKADERSWVAMQDFFRETFGTK